MIIDTKDTLNSLIAIFDKSADNRYDRAGIEDEGALVRAYALGEANAYSCASLLLVQKIIDLYGE